jgi:predicted amidophosphoribosyltransferase
MANAVPMLWRCARGQRPQHDGPTCVTCGERATELRGFSPLCHECAQQSVQRMVREREARRQAQ